MRSGGQFTVSGGAVVLGDLETVSPSGSETTRMDTSFHSSLCGRETHRGELRN